MKRAILLTVLILFPPFFLYGSSDHTADDSVNVVMDLNIDPKIYEERRGGIVQNVRLYTSSGQSLIVWSDERDAFIYTVRDTNHEERAMALIDSVVGGEMISYVFKRKPQKSVKYSKYYTVIALQIRPEGSGN